MPALCLQDRPRQTFMNKSLDLASAFCKVHVYLKVAILDTLKIQDKEIIAQTMVDHVVGAASVSLQGR